MVEYIDGVPIIIQFIFSLKRIVYRSKQNMHVDTYLLLGKIKHTKLIKCVVVVAAAADVSFDYYSLEWMSKNQLIYIYWMDF